MVVKNISLRGEGEEGANRHGSYFQRRVPQSSLSALTLARKQAATKPADRADRDLCMK